VSGAAATGVTRVKTTVVAVLVIGLLLWRSGAALYQGAEEIRSVGLGERLDKVLVDLEDVYRATAREHYEIFAALRKHVPRDVHLVIYTHVTDEQRTDKEKNLAIKKEMTLLTNKLRSLHFPALVNYLGGDVPNVEDYLSRLDPSCYVINVTPEVEFPGQDSFDLVDRGESYSLHRFRGAD
jgi:hypothetical protein